MFAWIARVVVRRPLLTILVWVVAAVIVVAFAPSLRTSSEQSSFLPDHYESIQAINLAQKAFAGNGAGGPTGVLVVERADGTPLTAADQARVGELATDLAGRRIERVSAVATGPRAVAPNRQVQLVNVAFTGGSEDPATIQAVKDLRAEVASQLRGTGLRAGLAGEVASAADSQEVFNTAERLIFLATILLIIALQLAIFRSPIAAALPIATVLLVFLISRGLIGVAGDLFGLRADQSLTTLLTVVLFGIGTDYILFLLFRYRERLRAGDQPKQALVTATARIGEVIASAAAAVIIAFCALSLSSLGFLHAMGPSMAIAVAVMLVAALTLIPAVISLLGPRVFWPSKSWRREPRGSLPRRAGNLVGRRPAVVALGAGAVMVALALGVLGFVGNYDFSQSLPDDTESARAFRDLQRGFPAGALEPTNVYLRSDSGQRLDQATVQRFARLLGTVPGVGSAQPPQLSSDGTVAQVDLLLRDSPSSSGAISSLENQIRPAAHRAAPAGTTALVGGPTAIVVDISDAIARDYRVVFPVAGLLIAIVLALLLRSVVAPWYLMAAVALTFVATLGGAVLIFQGAFGESGLLGYMPIFVYLFVVAIGTDYNILMVARLREEARAGNQPRQAARLAVAHAGPSVASAGVILAGSFASLALAGVSLLSQLGLSVATGIVISAFVMSMFLVPALTTLIGHTAWWPGHGDRPERDGGRVPVAELDQELTRAQP
ncbi:MAG TPA: MMPL family transporter [Actinomycetes bacterium]|nr:MMPL family transporter [Actinomycetes bacterium]